MRVSIRKRGERLIRRRELIVDVIDNARPVVQRGNKCQRTGERVDPETGMQLSRGRLNRLPIQPNDAKPARVEERARWEGPPRQIGIGVTKKKATEIDFRAR